jgi:hypothetical protein
MAKIGRNDPCPCGSGKKYKNCCLNKERAKRVRDSAWVHDEQVTLGKLVTFAQSPHMGAQILVASNLFWNGNYGSEGLNALDDEEKGRFLDWYVYDYRLEQSRKRVIDLFVKDAAPNLPSVEQERLLAWQGSYLSLYRVERPVAQRQLSVTDTLMGEDQVVLAVGVERLGVAGDLILGRILRSSDPPHFSWAAVLLPSEVESGLVSFIRGTYAYYRERHVEAAWPDYLSDSGYVLNHYLLKSVAESAPRRRTTGAYYDASSTVDRLREVGKRLREQAAKQAQGRERPSEQEADEEGVALKQTSGGILLPGHVEHEDGQKSKR